MNYDYNTLLEYLSHKKTGQWKDFKSYVQNLNYANSFEIRHNEIFRMLSSLGHVEFLFNDDEQLFSIAPAGICLCSESFQGVLCGYRDKKLLRELKEQCKELKIEMNAFKQDCAPDAILINFQNKDILNEFIKKTSQDLYITQNFSKRLLNNLPDLKDIINNLKKQTPTTIDINASNVFLHDWLNNKRVSAKSRGIDECNLYEQEFYNKREFYVTFNEMFYKIDRNYGFCISRSIRKTKHLKFQNNKLEIINAYIPELIDRALTLASGFNRKKTGYDKYVYDNIDIETAKLASRKTGLLLEIKNG